MAYVSWIQRKVKKGWKVQASSIFKTITLKMSLRAVYTRITKTHRRTLHLYTACFSTLHTNTRTIGLLQSVASICRNLRIILSYVHAKLADGKMQIDYKKTRSLHFLYKT